MQQHTKMNKRTCKHKEWTPVKNGFQYCTSCHAEFPCKKNCAHVDCVDVRGVLPECERCDRGINEEDMYWLASTAGHIVPLHVFCVEVVNNETL